MTKKKSILFWTLYAAAVFFCCGFLTAVLTGCAVKAPLPSPTPVGAADHTITLTWSQSFADSPACSSTVKASCISGFTEGYLSGTVQEMLQADTAAVCTGSAQPESCASTFNGVIPIGVVNFYVDTAYIDQNGAACSGAAAGTAGGAADCLLATGTTANPPTVGADAATAIAAKIQ